MVEALAQEYLKIMDVIVHYDELTMTIKGWSITVGIAIIGLALQQGKRSLLLLCCVSAFAFSFVDAKFKEYQGCYYPRMVVIEKCMSEELAGKECTPLKVDKSWRENKSWYGVVFQYGKMGVLMPHIFIFAAALFLYKGNDYFTSKPQLTKG